MKELDKAYLVVKHLGGAGDQGRDIEALVTTPCSEHGWDLYQCKRYNAPLAPTEFFPELAKFFRHLALKSYPEPRRYYICAPQDCGTKLSDILLGDSTKFREKFLKAWGEGSYGLNPGELTTYLKALIGAFDFSRIREFQARDLLEVHSRNQTAHFKLFGIRPLRPEDPPPPSVPDSMEGRYIAALLAVYSEHAGMPLTFPELDETDLDHVQNSRAMFYSAEGLRLFSRDNFPDKFEELLRGALVVVKPSINHPSLKTGYDRLQRAIDTVSTLQMTENPLRKSLRPPDLPGVCHHLANEGSIKWVK